MLLHLFSKGLFILLVPLRKILWGRCRVLSVVGNETCDLKVTGTAQLGEGMFTFRCLSDAFIHPVQLRVLVCQLDVFYSSVSGALSAPCVQRTRYPQPNCNTWREESSGSSVELPAEA